MDNRTTEIKNLLEKQYAYACWDQKCRDAIFAEALRTAAPHDFYNDFYEIRLVCLRLVDYTTVIFNIGYNAGAVNERAELSRTIHSR